LIKLPPDRKLSAEDGESSLFKNYALDGSTIKSMNGSSLKVKNLGASRNYGT